MNSQSSTKQLRKTKLLQNYRNTININATQPPPQPQSSNRTKILLTDLCPEQKAKIGELVRTLENRKSENMRMEEKIREMGQRERKFLQRIEELEKNMEMSRIVSQKFKEEITLMKVKEQERERYIQHLLSQKQQKQKDKSSKKNTQTAYVDQFALTDPVITINQSIQVAPKQKKKKQKQKQTQTEQIQQKNRRYPNNSRSFEKIMKGRVQSQGNGNGNGNDYRYSDSRSAGRSQSSKNKYHGHYKQKQKGNKKKSNIMIDDQNQEYRDQEENQENLEDEQEEENYQGEQEYQVKHSQDEDEDFNQLAKKWLELKQKNMSKIKQSYKKSKQKAQNTASQEKSNKKISRSVAIPRQFNEKNITEQDHEQSNIDYQNPQIILQANQSFGPKKPKKKQPVSHHHESIDQDFDQIQLNKILKSKNFSASRLLNKPNLQPSQPPFNPRLGLNSSSQRKSTNLLQSQNSYYAPPQQNPSIPMNINLGQGLNPGLGMGMGSGPSMTSGMKMSNASGSASGSRMGGIDFYQTDLLDIVSSVKRK